MHLENNLKNGVDELIENQEDVIEALKSADHFYITHYCKKRDRIEERRCFWDSKSKIWETANGKFAITCVALNQETYEIDGYRTFTDVFAVSGYKHIQGSEEVQ